MFLQNQLETPKILADFDLESKTKIPMSIVKSGVIPFKTAATELSITVSAKAKR